MTTPHIQAADQIPAAALRLKREQIVNAIAFIIATSEYHRSDEAFRSVVDTVVSQGSISSSALAEVFEVNTATISRWKSGKNAPHPRERPAIINWIQRKLTSDLEEIDGKIDRLDSERGHISTRNRLEAAIA